MKKIIVLLILLLFVIVGCSTNTNKDKDNYGLMSISGSKKLNSLIKKSRPRISFNWFSKSEDTIDAEGTSSYQSSDYTKTNVQVEGVDEGDIMKTDGSRIYSTSRDRLQVIKMLVEGKMEILLNDKIASDISTLDYYHNTYYSGIYLTDNYLIVIGQKYCYNYMYGKDSDTNIKKTDPYYFSTNVSIIDIYEKANLTKIDHYEISGKLLGSRLINDNLYLISNYFTNNYDDFDYDIRPWYTHNNISEFYNYEDIKYIPNSTYQSFTIISTVSLKKDNITIDNDIFLSTSSWGQIYVTKSAIYFASNYATSNLFGTYNSIGLLVSFQFDEVTGEVLFGGYGNYEGSVIDQFSMDEYNGFIRIATTEGWGTGAKNRVYIFTRTLKNEIYILEQISLIDSGIGKTGERIQSVRFNKDIATIVTFLKTDPFYTIDLTDPYNPVIAGELEIPGFSTYQHPWAENLIIGIGFDADANGRTKGIKISLYDITDITNPIEVGDPLLFHNDQSEWNYSESTYNHKAIMIDKTRNSIGISMTSNKWGGVLKCIT